MQAPAISTAHIARVKDACCTLALRLNREMLRDIIVANDCMQRRTLIVSHIHDEASFRVRSFLDLSGGAGGVADIRRVNRSTSSKVQNHVVTLIMGDRRLEWLTELQAMQRKDASSLAETLTLVVKEIASIVADADANALVGQVRLVHVITADGLATNAAAARRLLHDARQKFPGVSYRVVNWVCASHITCLVVQRSICGGSVQKPEENNALCCAAARYFKYLTPLYAEEFGHALQSLVVERLRIVDVVATPQGEGFAELYRCLYGNASLPQELTGLLNVSFTLCTHSRGGDAIEPIERTRGRLVALLYKLLLVADEKPVATRFWTFGVCMRTLLLMRLIGIPSDMFKLSVMCPVAENAKRLRGLREWYDDAASDGELRVVCMCLHITDIPLNMTAQQQNAFERVMNVDPMVARLARCEV